MEIKTQSQEKSISTHASKEGQKVPSRSFKEVMSHTKLPRVSRKKETVFDLASKEKKKENPTKETPQAVEGAVELAPSIVTEGMEVAEINPVEISSIVEEMAEYIKIESDNGISKTTVKVSMQGTVFEGSEIVIDHYDTAPHSFNLQLMGNPEAMQLFEAHLGTLQLSLNAHEALKGFQVHIMQPVLTQKSELYSRGRSRESKKKDAMLKGAGNTVSSVQKK